MTITEKDMLVLGSTDPWEWMKESYRIIEKDIKTIFRKDFNIKVIRPSNIDDFIHNVKAYVEQHPDCEIKASAFIITKERK